MTNFELGDGSETVTVRHEESTGGVRLSIYKTGAYMSVLVDEEVAQLIARALVEKGPA